MTLDVSLYIIKSSSIPAMLCSFMVPFKEIKLSHPIFQYCYSNVQNVSLYKYYLDFTINNLLPFVSLHFLHRPVFAALLTTPPTPSQAPFPWSPSKVSTWLYNYIWIGIEPLSKRSFTFCTVLLENQFNQNTTVSLVQF